MKITCPFHNILQVLKVLLIKIYEQSPVLLLCIVCVKYIRLVQNNRFLGSCSANSRNTRLAKQIFNCGCQLRNFRQLSFVMLNSSPVLNDQNQVLWNTKKNEINNTPLLCVVFQVLNVLLLKRYKIQLPSSFYFFLFYINLYIRRYHFLTRFQNLIQNCLK